MVDGGWGIDKLALVCELRPARCLLPIAANRHSTLTRYRSGRPGRPLTGPKVQ